MVEDGTYTAVLDRLEEDDAVLVLERHGRAVDDIVVSLDSLPEDARVPDAVFDVRMACGRLVDVTFDPDRTARRRHRAQRRFARLSRRLSDCREGEDEDEGDAVRDSGCDSDSTRGDDSR